MWEVSLIIGGLASLLGTSFASFFTCVVQRQRAHLPWVTTTSVCDYCRRPLNWKNNLPIISYILGHGRSQCCHKQLTPVYLITEVMGAIIGFGLGVAASNYLIQAWV
jgi:general secretion pathway protein O